MVIGKMKIEHTILRVVYLIKYRVLIDELGGKKEILFKILQKCVPMYGKPNRKFCYS